MILGTPCFEWSTPLRCYCVQLIGECSLTERWPSTRRGLSRARVLPSHCKVADKQLPAAWADGGVCNKEAEGGCEGLNEDGGDDEGATACDREPALRRTRSDPLQEFSCKVERKIAGFPQFTAYYLAV